MATNTTNPTNPTLPSPFQQSSSSSTSSPLHLITQGAEAHLYKTTFLTPTTPSALKIRPKKNWRHPTLDRRLTRARILAEGRVLAKCRREGVVVPAVLGMSWEEGWVALEWIEGGMVKDVVRTFSSREVREEKEEGLKDLLYRIGKAIGKLHSIGVVHGDLTTSNMLLRPDSSSSTIASSHPPSSEGSVANNEPSIPLSLEGEIVLIDFGLATQTVQDEDRAVDLYVLERAFGSTHPREEHLFPLVLEAYEGSYKGAKAALRRLEDVRMRGRKKSMIG